MRLRRNVQWLDATIFSFMACAILFSFPANLLRLSGQYRLVEIYSDSIFLGAIALGSISLCTSRVVFLWERAWVVSFAIFLCWILTLGVVRGNDDPLLGMRFFVLPIFVYFLAQKCRSIQFFYCSARFWQFVVVTHMAGLLIYYNFLHGTIYPGIGVQSIGFAAMFFAATSSWGWLLVCLIIVLLEAKRSILLTLILSLALILFLRSAGDRSLFRHLLAGGALGGVILSLALFFLAQLDAPGTIGRFNLINPFSSTFDVFLGSSGRWGELVSFFAEKNMVDLVFGSGSGFAYEWFLGYDSGQNHQIKGYFHMSGANYVASGGVLGAFVFLYLFVFVRYGLLSSTNKQVAAAAAGFALFSLLQSFFGFNLAADPVMWMFILYPMVLYKMRITGRVAYAVS